MHVCFLQNIKCGKEHMTQCCSMNFHKLVQHTFQVPTNLNEKNYIPQYCMHYK